MASVHQRHAVPVHQAIERRLQQHIGDEEAPLQADAVDGYADDRVSTAGIYANGHPDNEAAARSGGSKMRAEGMGSAEANGIKQPLLHEAANGHADDVVDAGMASGRRSGA